MTERIRAWARERHGWQWLAFVLDVQKRVGELHGGHLAAAITLMAFLSLFPLMVVAVAVVGFVSSGGADVPGKVVEALGLPAGGEAATQIRDAVSNAEDSRRAASVIGLVGLAWAGLGLVGALQGAYNAVWQVQGRGIRDRLFGLVWLAGAGGIFVASFVATGAVAYLPAVLAPLGVVVGFGMSLGLWWWSSRVLANRDVGWRPLLPGALVGAAGFEVLKLVGSFYVPNAIASSSALYGSIGLVFALLAWLFFFGRLVIYSAVFNVLMWERRYGTTYTTIEVPRLPGTLFADVSRAGNVADAEPPQSPLDGHEHVGHVDEPTRATTSSG